jgi:hypothetical protein
LLVFIKKSGLLALKMTFIQIFTRNMKEFRKKEGLLQMKLAELACSTTRLPY